MSRFSYYKFTVVWIFLIFSLSHELFSHTASCLFLICMDLLTFPPGVNQFCQDILDMIRHCPPWCGKVLLYFKACWVFCTPFLLLVSAHLCINIGTCSQEVLFQYDTSYLLLATRFETGQTPPFYSLTMFPEVYFLIFLHVHMMSGLLNRQFAKCFRRIHRM